MCGIAGILALDAHAAAPDRDALARMAAALTHRGPDGLGVFRDGPVGLAHSRLAIIDLTSGQQPMSDVSQRYWVVFNGEIFNYRELRRELEARGHRFATQSDTEVLLAAFVTWGSGAVARCNGQWAAAIWDRRTRELTLARDPSGICPLHLLLHRGQLFFASEVKAIFAADATIPRAFDPIGLQQTFTFWSIVPPRGVFAGVTELEPGHVRTYRPDGTSREDAPPPPAFPPRTADHAQFSLDDAADTVQRALVAATQLRLCSDVPVGCFLSGGLDSSLIASLAAESLTQPLRAFSLRFEDAEYDEHRFQREMVEQLGTVHHEVTVTTRDIADIFPTVCWHTERPILRTAPAPLFLLSRFVRGHGVPVVLTGEGADEMFAGYDLFREGKVRRFWARQPASTWRPQLLDRLYPWLARSPVTQRAIARQFFGRHLSQFRAPGFAHGPRWDTTSALQRLFSGDLRASIPDGTPVTALVDALPPSFSAWTDLAQDQHLEITTLLVGYLLSSQGDRMLLGNGVEGRFPFLDPEVIALAHALPDHAKLRGLSEKHILKRVARGRLPATILARPKQPYRAPDAQVFVEPGAPAWVGEMLSDEVVRHAGLFDPRAVTQLYAKGRARAGAGGFSNSDNMALVGVLSAQLIYHSLVSAAPAVRSTTPLAVDIDAATLPH